MTTRREIENLIQLKADEAGVQTHFVDPAVNIRT